jgi:choline-sulfatase
MAHRSHKTRNTPWTLTVNLNYPHFPHYVSQDLWDLYPEGEDLPEFGIHEDSAGHPRAEDMRTHLELDGFTEAQVRGQRRGYLGCVTFIDQQIGRLIQALKTSGQHDETNFIYTSDHHDLSSRPSIASGENYS